MAAYPPNQPPYPQNQGQQPYSAQPQNPPRYPQAYPPQYPPPYYPYPYPPPQQKKGFGCGGCLLTCLALMVICVVGLVALGGGGYLLFASGAIKLEQRDMLALIGRAPGEAGVINYAQVPVSVTIAAQDPENTDTALMKNSMDLQPLDSDSFMVNPGVYILQFTVANGQSGTCTLHVGSNEVYQFAVLEEGTLVTRKGTDPKNRDEFIVSTSSLCRP